MKKTFLLLTVLFWIGAASAQIPEGYYTGTEGLSGSALKTKLKEVIVRDVTSLAYTDLWDAYKSTDRRPDGTVWDTYSNCNYTFVTDQCGNYSAECDCYNREHLVPRAWFGGEIAPMNTDLFNVYPTDGKVNGVRDNYPFGEVTSATFTSKNGSKLGPNTFPGYSGVVFEPIDEYKGDFARSYFYMVTRHSGDTWLGSAMITTDVQLTPWAVALLRKWHAQDPVSQKETDRNNAVFALQKNRNPYIDHPEFVEAIWGTATSAETLPAVSIRTFPNPADTYCSIVHNGYFTAKVNITIIDVTGKKQRVSATRGPDRVTLRIGGYEPGVYIVKLEQPGKTPFYGRILKK